MTRALYHELPTRLTFTATVTDVQGERVALDATAFYPEGGGQNADVGLLRWVGKEARVADTRKDKASGVIWHTLEGGVPAVGREVTGEVDPGTRWRNSARHSGEHLLAQAFYRINPAFRVVAVSMRHAESTIDLEGNPGEADVRAAETLLRETLGRTDLTLETPTVPEEDLHRYPLRRDAKVGGQVRLVIFREADGTPFDVSACGGTHMPHASRAAPVVVVRTERIRSGLTRVVFVAGEEASGFLGGVYRDARTLAQGFSTSVGALPGRVETLVQERNTLKEEVTALRAGLARLQVAASPVEDVVGVSLRCVTLDDAALLSGTLENVPVGEVRAVLVPGGRCGVASGHPEVPAGALLSASLKATGGKGGGRPELAQGTTGQPQAFLAAVRGALEALRQGQVS
ncbi:alanyl-tRNA editing protein [Deinococcus hopiensis]|uniref:Alanyl-tRNA synthetase n=1 Tax=Deinococcus hopiensis KR-140 TaxID=695939 RepID=A0A1W1VIB1_9DEIO|nr:alanine--tRNA ligase-related protein [Deinococcus hopiensis]SMB93013.1 alanyl-tRNA synthetase [Deinococcus hopiensis KR-140]